MIALLGGLTAAALWAVSALASSRSSRIIGPSSTVGWMMLVGLVIAGPLALMSGPMPVITPTLALWIAGSGLGGVVGLLLEFRGLRAGKVGIVTALTSTEGAIAACLAIVAGESLTVPVLAVLGVIVLGILAIALAAGEADGPGGVGVTRGAREAVFCGVAAALCFGLAIFSAAQVSLAMSPFAAIFPSRVVGVAGVLIPMALTGRLRINRRAAVLASVVGITEVVGTAAYLLGARESIAIAAVLASQFGAVAAVVAFFLFRERLGPRQLAGVAAIVLGVAVLAAIRS